MERPVYQDRPIRSVQALCRALRCPETRLRELAANAACYYYGPRAKLKKDGRSYRYVYGTYPPLKPLLETVKRVLLRRIDFPQYLHGSLPCRDVVSNARLHTHAQIVIHEDIEKYFDRIPAPLVLRVWRDCLEFGPGPAALLTAITTKDGCVIQGAPTSSYLANLVFWDVEGQLAAKLASHGWKYSRYVDDVTLSASVPMANADKTWAIAQVFAMLGSRGFRGSRKKHSIESAVRSMPVLGVNVNHDVSLPQRERSRIRAAVYQLEQRMCSGAPHDKELVQELRKVAGRIGYLARFHPVEAAKLSSRIQELQRRTVATI